MSSVKFVKQKSIHLLDGLLKEDLGLIFKKGEKIAIKLHMGEPKNKHFISPNFVKKVVDILKEIGVKPYLFDSPVMYSGPRDTEEKYLKTAEKNGFNKSNCPIIISDEAVPYKTQNLNVEVCRPLIKADGILVLSHVKGHACSGFGGAIKNLGMGGVTKKTKENIHTASQPITSDLCKGCGICAENCFCNAMKIENGKAICNYEDCWGCGICISYCPNDSLKPRVASFDKLLAESAYAVVKSVKKSFYINYLFDITKWCDCASDPGPIIAKDLGILFSDDIVAIDKASVNLVNKAMDKNVFLEANKKSPLIHIKEMEILLKNDSG